MNASNRPARPSRPGSGRGPGTRRGARFAAGFALGCLLLGGCREQNEPVKPIADLPATLAALLASVPTPTPIASARTTLPA